MKYWSPRKPLTTSMLFVLLFCVFRQVNKHKYTSTNSWHMLQYLQLHHHPLVLHAQVVMSVLWEIVKVLIETYYYHTTLIICIWIQCMLGHVCELLTITFMQVPKKTVHTQEMYYAYSACYIAIAYILFIINNILHFHIQLIIIRVITGVWYRSAQVQQ